MSENKNVIIQNMECSNLVVIQLNVIYGCKWSVSTFW